MNILADLAIWAFGIWLLAHLVFEKQIAVRRMRNLQRKAEVLGFREEFDAELKKMFITNRRLMEVSGRKHGHTWLALTGIAQDLFERERHRKR